MIDTNKIVVGIGRVAPPHQTDNIINMVRNAVTRIETLEPEVRKHYSPELWCHEFQTLQLNLGRQCGHTTAAKRLLTDYNYNGIILVYNFDMIKRVVDGDSRLHNKVYSVGVAGYNHVPDVNYDFIIFDVAGYGPWNSEQKHVFKMKMSPLTKLFIELE